MIELLGRRRVPTTGALRATLRQVSDATGLTLPGLVPHIVANRKEWGPLRSKLVAPCNEAMADMVLSKLIEPAALQGLAFAWKSCFVVPKPLGHYELHCIVDVSLHWTDGVAGLPARAHLDLDLSLGGAWGLLSSI